jgi:hypothetical protein
MPALARTYDAAIREFGYGREGVVHHTYCDDVAAVKVDDPRVKWLVLERSGEGAGGRCGRMCG